MTTPAQDLLRQEDSKRIGFRFVRVLGVVIVKQRWERIEDALLQALTAELRSIPTVTDLQMDGLPYPGTWELVDVEAGPLRTDPSVQGITRTLAQRLDATFFAFVSSQNCEEYGLTYLYSGSPYPISAPENSQGIVYSATSSRNPETGAYDGSVTRTEARPKQYSFRSVLGPRRRGQESDYERIGEAYDAPGVTGPGRSTASFRLNSDCTYSGQVGVSIPIPATLEFVSSLNVFGTDLEATYNDAAAPVPLPAPAQGQTVTGSNAYNEDGAYDAGIKVSVSTPQSWSFRSSLSSRRQSLSYDYRNQRAAVLLPATAPGPGTWTASLDYQTDGTYNAGLVWSGPSTPHALEWLSSNALFDTERRADYQDYAAPVAGPVPLQGQTVQTTQSEKPDGTYDSGVSVKTSHAAAWSFRSSLSSRRQSLSYDYRNQLAAVLLPATAPGPGTWRGSLEYQTDGTYNAGLVWEGPSTPHSLEWLSSNSLFDTERRADYQDYPAPVDGPVPAQGQTVQTSQSENADGSYNSGVAVKTSHEASWSFRSSLSSRRQSLSYDYRNQHAAILLPATAPGPGTWRGSLEYQTDGTYNAGFVWEGPSTPHALEWLASNSLFSTERRADYQDYPTPVAGPTPAQGETVQTTQSEKADGTYDSGVAVKTSKEASWSFRSSLTSRRQSLSYDYRNQRAAVLLPATAPGPGTWRATLDYQTDGTFNAGLNYDSPGQARGWQWRSSSDAISEGVNYAYVDYAVPQDIPEAPDGHRIAGSVSETSEGAYNTTIGADRAIKVDTGWVTFTDVRGDHSFRSFVNFTAAEAASVGADITDAHDGDFSYSPSGFVGRYNGSASRKPATWTLSGFDTPQDFDFYMQTLEPAKAGHVYVRMTSSKTTAASFLSGAVNVLEDLGGHQVGMNYIGKGIWKACKIL